MTTITWTKDANGNHEISSPEHLIQLMNGGSKYTDAGDHPNTSGTYYDKNYIQTVDIDLAGYHEHIIPIGNSTDVFSGNFDGASYSISNWSYVNANNSFENVGLFGKCGGSTLQNIRLAGIWAVGKFGQHCGFLCGYIDGFGSVYNCEGNFEQGTTMSGETEYLHGGLGVLVGKFISTSVHGLTTRGSINMEQTTTQAGGVIGSADVSKNFKMSYVRNLATFPSGIKSTRFVGGVIGYLRTLSNTTVSNIVNVMHGDLYSDSTQQGTSGGVIGHLFSLNGSTARTDVVDTIVNAMVGNISGKADSTGGIMGSFHTWSYNNKLTRLANYMRGDIIDGGGLLGNVYTNKGGTTHEISNSIVAMNGAADKALLHFVEHSAPWGVGITATVNTDFGMTFNTNEFTLAPSVGDGFLEFPMFSDLPYLDLSGTDDKGNVYVWEFVFANVGGKDKYSAYTHAIIHTGKMTSPLFSDFGTLTGTHLAFANVDTGELFTSGSVTPVVTDATTVLEYSLSALATKASPIAVTTTVLPVVGAVDLKLTYQAPGGDEETAFTGFLGGDKRIDTLEPETEYTLRLYADMGTGAGYEFQEATLASTPANTAENYEVEDFVEGGKVRLDRLSSSAKKRMSAVLNELFTTGDAVRVGVSRGVRKYADAKFVNRGGMQRIREAESETIVEALLLPFDATSGSGQNISLQLSDDSTKTVEYDDVQNTVAVDSSVYSPGDTFVIDGLKCTVFEDL